MENKRPQLDSGKFTGISKHKVKVGNLPHTNIISKPAIMSRVQMQDIGNAFEMKISTT